jgi:dihydrofolate reductase
MQEPRKVILYIAMSIDGYIADKEDDLSFLSLVEKEGEDYGYSEFIKTVDTVIMGRKTYDKVLSFGIHFPHSDKKTYILTRTPRASIGNTEFYTKDISTLIHAIKAEKGKHIFIDGGAQLVSLLMKEKLIDEFVISIIPIILGDGIALFKSQSPEITLELKSAIHFDSGLVQLKYFKVS